LDAPLSRESASSLWCVVNEFHPGNVTFDFTNKKEKGQKLEVTVNKNWPAVGGFLTSPEAGYIPGDLSGWHFSTSYATSVYERKPIFAYINAAHDSVAVLCFDLSTSLSDDKGLPVVVKLARVSDGLNNKVPGML